MKLVKISDGVYDVVDSDGAKLGTVERFNRVASLVQWRFMLGGSPLTLLNDEYVEIASTRSEAVTKGVDFAERARTVEAADERLWADLLDLSEKYARTQSAQDFRTGEAHRLLGAMEYITGRLVEGGVDRGVLSRVMHRAAAEDWQVKAVAV